LDDTRNLLNEEQKKLEDNKNIDADCLAKLQNINKVSQAQLKQLQQNIE